MYHERQKWALCGVHAINNLLQEPKLDKTFFDTICEELAPSSSKYWNPHRSVLGLGNYDVNVLLVILERQGFQVKWHDLRDTITSATLHAYFPINEQKNCDSVDSVAPTQSQPESASATARATAAATFGIVVNLPSTGIWGTLSKGRHWATLLWSREKKVWMNLNSELKQPEEIGDFEQCAKLLQHWQREKGECPILLARRD